MVSGYQTAKKLLRVVDGIPAEGLHERCLTFRIRVFFLSREIATLHGLSAATDRTRALQSRELRRGRDSEELEYPRGS